MSKVAATVLVLILGLILAASALA
ncbi:MAG: hypothetical protein HW377_1143, partial [Actinobacteria bacterium]|nr:hypothetical protein [Actinomycetota bacterium]